LILRGRVFSYYAKQLAQHAAMQIHGLPILANEIHVQWDLAVPDADASDSA
jgi:hypothetical protein